MEITEIELDEMRQQAEEFYKTIGEVNCPYLRGGVMFNAKGFGHIKFKKGQETRSPQDQYTRLRLLRIVPDIIKQSHTLQEYFETNQLERQIINSRWEKRVVRVKYYGFIAIINSQRAKVVVKEIEGGSKFFWSLIPLWKTKRDAVNDVNKKILHEGDLETE